MNIIFFKKSGRIAIFLIISIGTCISIASPQNDAERNVFLINNSEFWKAFKGAYDDDIIHNPYKYFNKLKIKAIQDENGKIHFFYSKKMEPVSDTSVGKRIIGHLKKHITSIYKANENKYVKDYLFLKKFLELNPSYPMLLPDLTNKGSINFKDLESDIEKFMIPVFKQLMHELKKDRKEESLLDRQGSMIEAKVSTSNLEMAESLDPRMEFWARRVQKIVQQQWFPTKFEITGSAQVTVKFTVKRNGDVVKIGIARSSGNKDLDQAGIKTIERIGKMPPIPPNYKEKDEISVNIIFDYEDK